MPDEQFWRERYNQLGEYSVGPGNTQNESDLEEHRQHFLRAALPWLGQLQGPVLDFGCGIGRWVMDLPRPYLGLDLLPEYIEYCRSKYTSLSDVSFQLSSKLSEIQNESFSSVFTVVVLQHIVEKDLRNEVIKQFHRILKKDGLLISVEWAPGQRNYDWCTEVSDRDWGRWFKAKAVSQVVENGRWHTVWLGKKSNNMISRFKTYLGK